MADISGSHVFKLSDFHHILIENDFHYNYEQVKPTSSGAFSEQRQTRGMTSGLLTSLDDGHQHNYGEKVCKVISK
ncbi:hypothetical protein DMR30_28030 [Klebsiella variicola]|uniref:hypothetical protein n=1 Tax=Klebsiella variicola TaxID=244366 RepID=UPI0007D6D3F9|nr:hypothetical protein [Klebsiella variicola]PXJ79457.1 hypothetical protein DMR30_28030 [Klebsiella variicola]